MLNPEEYYKLYIGIGVALIGGVVSYLVTTEKYTIKDALVKGISSGFIGLLIGLLSLYANMPEPLAFFLCGTFGYMGSEITITLLKRWVERRIQSIK